MKEVPNSPTNEQVLTAEFLELPSRDPKKPLHTWIFDPIPEIIDVPRLK